MANISIGGRLSLLQRVASLDLRYGPYSSIADAYENMGPSGDEVITAGLPFGVTEDDGSVSVYIWTKGEDATQNDCRKLDKEHIILFNGFIDISVSIKQQSYNDVATKDNIVFLNDRKQFAYRDGLNFYINWKNRYVWSNENLIPYDDVIYIDINDNKAYYYNGTTLTLLVSEAFVSSINNQAPDENGNVNITKEHIGLENVNNTADEDKIVKGASEDGSGNVITTTYETKTDATTKQTTLQGAINALQTSVAALTGLDSTNFGGFSIQSTEADAISNIATLYTADGYTDELLWYMAGTSLSSVKAYRYNGSGTPTAISSDTYNCVDFSGLIADVSTLSQNLAALGPEIDQSTNYTNTVVGDLEFSVGSTKSIIQSLSATLAVGKRYILKINTTGFESTDKWDYSYPIYLKDDSNNRLYLKDLLGITGGTLVGETEYGCEFVADYTFNKVVVSLSSTYVASESKEFSLSITETESLKTRISSIEQTAQQQGGSIEELQEDVEDLNLQLIGGTKYYVNEEFDISNGFIDANSTTVELSEPIDSFFYKFIVPSGITINTFGIRVWEDDGTTNHTFTADGINQECELTERTYNVTKVAIVGVSPDQTYTGTFGLQVYRKVEAAVAGKIDKSSIVQTSGTDTTKVMSQKAVTDLVNEAVSDVAEISDTVNSLDVAVNGGEAVIADETSEYNNGWINAALSYAELPTPSKDFRFKVIFSNPSAVTSYSVYIWYLESEDKTSRTGLTNNTYYTNPLGELYTVSKIAVSAINPDAKYTGTIRIVIEAEQESVVASKAELAAVDAKIDYDERLTIPDYYFANDYLPNKVDFIRNLLEGCMLNGDAFFFQTDEHWEMNAQHSPALIKYIADRLNISRLFDGGDTTHNIDAYGLAHVNPAAIDFEMLRRRTFHGRMYHTIGNHEYLTWGFQNADKWDGVDFGNWHDFMYYQRQDYDNVVYGDLDKHYYYVDNVAKKIRYIVLSAYKKKETPLQSGNNYYSIAEFDYSNDQLSWFTGTALNVEIGWTILVFTHYFIGFTHGERDGDGYVANVVQNMSDACKPFAQAMLQYSGNGEIAAVIEGHLHCDGIFTINDQSAGLSGASATGKSIPCIGTTCDAYDFDALGASEKLYNRDVDTITEQAFDVVVLDKTTKKMTFVRIGAPAYDILTQASNGKYPLFGDLEYREVTYGNS